MKSLKIEKCPEKNDHLSDNLAIGTLMYHQKNYIFQKKKKKIQVVKTWKRALLEAIAPQFHSACPRHLAFLHHALSLIPWFGIGLCLAGITMLALVSWMC